MVDKKAEKLFEEALQLAQEGKLNEAIWKWDGVIPLLDGENKAKAYNNRGNAKRLIGDYAGSIADYDQALVINPQYAEAYSNRGNTKNDLGRPRGRFRRL